MKERNMGKKYVELNAVLRKQCWSFNIPNFVLVSDIMTIPAVDVDKATKRRGKNMFKKFVQMIIDAKNREEAINSVFYGTDGIDVSYQKGKITWKEHQMLLALIEKMA